MWKQIDSLKNQVQEILSMNRIKPQEMQANLAIFFVFLKSNKLIRCVVGCVFFFGVLFGSVCKIDKFCSCVILLLYASFFRSCWVVFFLFSLLFTVASFRFFFVFFKRVFLFHFSFYRIGIYSNRFSIEFFFVF